MRPKILTEQNYSGRIVVGFRFRFSAEVGPFLSGRSPGSEVAFSPAASPSPATAEWDHDTAILAYSGGTAPVFHRLPFSGTSAT